MSALFVITTTDVDDVIGERNITDDQRDNIYDHVKRMDSSLIFDQIDDVILWELGQ